MKASEFLTQAQEGGKYKFVADIARKIAWAWIPVNKQPYHAEVAVIVGLAKNLSLKKDWAEIIDKTTFRAGSFKINHGEFWSDEASTAYMDYYPEYHEFRALTTGGEINLVQV